MKIGAKIKSLRESLGITQSELAKHIHSTKQTIYKYETGIVTNIPSDKVEAIACALHTTPAYLMGWEDAELKTSEDMSGADVIIFDQGSAFDLAKLPDGTREDLEAVVKILPYECLEADFGLQLILDKKDVLNLDALPVNKKKEILNYIRFILQDEGRT